MSPFVFPASMLMLCLVWLGRIAPDGGRVKANRFGLKKFNAMLLWELPQLEPQFAPQFAEDLIEGAFEGTFKRAPG